ncbi:phage portal protein [Sphingomonas sanxanigenens]|uniref:Portal protein n=1 Tax=Sphingomonas sanxanigenens DSM 19645 = NX02 TaxID=1123269 RepID=W0A1E9_9SPHN|nr:phage portal protein [Sphingomonas sanxanigenens]AHE51764.1 portal protein [Sphingomonas sanxanigenens DSM 19645 = NX02]
MAGIIDRISTWLGGEIAAPAAGTPPAVAPGVQAYATLDLNDPNLPDFLRDGLGNAAGRTVTERSALRNATFSRAVTLISSAVGMLPLHLFEREADGDHRKAREHPVFGLLHAKPNSYQTPLEFKSFMQAKALLHGDGYAYKVRSRGRILALIPMDPRRVEVTLSDDWRKTFKWTRPSGQRVTLSQDEVFHLRAPLSMNGLNGEGLLKVAAEALGLAEAADSAASRLMRHGAYVGGVLKHPKKLSAEAIQNLADQFERRHAGPENAGKWIVAEEGMEPAPFGMSGKDAQGLEQRKYQAEEVSRFTGVPRPLLMFDETSWGSGIEQLGLFLVTYCLLPWFVAWEEAVARDLLADSERDVFFAKFNEGALLRGSLKEQAEFLSKALGGPGSAGFMVPNEAREKMNMNKIPGGDEPAWGQTAATPPADGE